MSSILDPVEPQARLFGLIVKEHESILELVDSLRKQSGVISVFQVHQGRALVRLHSCAFHRYSLETTQSFSHLQAHSFQLNECGDFRWNSEGLQDIPEKVCF